MKRMPAPSAASIRPVSASRDIIVPVGLAGLPTSTPFSGGLRYAAAGSAILGADAAELAASMGLTRPPAGSVQDQAAITSITMKGGTSLRADGVNKSVTRSLSVESSIDICYLHGRLRIQVPEPVT